MKLQQLLSGLLIAVAAGAVGCNLLPHIAYVAGGTMVQPQYEGLAEARVAVVCVADGASYGAGNESERLARGIASNLSTKVPEIDVVRWPEIADWIDRKGWDQIDYREVGRGVKADRVVAVDLASYQILDGSALYKGRADLTVIVYDMEQDGREVFRKEITEFTFPPNGPYYATEISEAKFNKLFLKMLADEVSKFFHAYDMIEEFGTPSI